MKVKNASADQKEKFTVKFKSFNDYGQEVRGQMNQEGGIHVIPFMRVCENKIRNMLEKFLVFVNTELV